MSAFIVATAVEIWNGFVASAGSSGTFEVVDWGRRIAETGNSVIENET